ncbi:hypothetical protein [Bradyrhizobium sp. CCBAU 051011]|uniref:hypothetical protein n=1 Tax=Bradyrhizobium sp. CCBAU 051011 TaxID=858422 RepID=UPI00192A6C33|nr:hypothetical protein [Bradyrhizobium sp. CCBAU 051011]
MSVSLISELWNSGRLCECMQAGKREPTLWRFRDENAKGSKLYRAQVATYLATTDAGGVRNISQKSQCHTTALGHKTTVGTGAFGDTNSSLVAPVKIGNGGSVCR